MSTDAKPAESVVEEPSELNSPDHSWGLEDLGQFAHRQHEDIIRAEHGLAPQYWLLGHALSLARKQVNRGQWERFLGQYGIDRVRACRARAIFGTFSTAEQLTGLTVEQAYSQRKKRQVHRRTREYAPAAEASGREGDSPPVARSPENLDAFFLLVQKGAQGLIGLIDGMDDEERRERFPLYRAALERLQALGRRLGAEDSPRPPADTRANDSMTTSQARPSPVVTPLVIADWPLVDDEHDEAARGGAI